MKSLYILAIFCVLFSLHYQRADGITDVQKSQIENGLKSAAELMKFFQEKNFFSMLTKISSVAGPLFSVANVVLTIVFLFIDTESPEMALMKKEFGKLNNRLDYWATEFLDVKRKIDWSSVKMSYGDYERSIKTVHRDLQLIVNSPKGMIENQKSIFIRKYESTFSNAADSLYFGMINTDMIFSENLFRASQKFTEYSRKDVQDFMTGLFQLLVQGIQVEATYVQLKYNNTKASDFLKDVWQKKLVVLKEKMSQIDEDTKNMFTKQYQTDTDNLLKKYNGLSNQAFSQKALEFFPKKYYWRDWFTVTYNDVSGFDNHAVSECSGTHRFRSYGRNFLISSRDKDTYRFSDQRKQVQNIMDNYSARPIVHHNRDGALRVVEDLRRLSGDTCINVYQVSAVQWGGGVWYWHHGGVLVYKKLCVLAHGYRCYNTFLFG